MARPTSGTGRTASRRAPLALAALALALTTACGGGGGAGTQPGSATLVSIDVAPATPSIAKGLSQPFTATGHYSDATTQDLTASATWTSSATGFATMSGATATGVGAGTTTITAAVGGKSGQATLTVGPATLVSIEVTPSSLSLEKGLSQVFAATGHYTDATTQDLTALATWTSSATGVATMAGATASAVGVGGATVTASYGGKSGSTLLTVAAAALVSIDVTPANLSLEKGLTQVFTATGRYTDSTTQDLSGVATWTSSASGVATLAGATASALGVGGTTVTASYGGKSGSTLLTVTTAALVSLDVSPASPSIAKGLTQPFTATGHYTDSTTQDLTAVATWMSSATGVGTMAGATATGVGVGSATITASYGGKSGSALLTVTVATLVSIEVWPANLVLEEGRTQLFTATGHYTDSTTQDLSGVATWTSSAIDVATITGATALAVGAGTTTIAASYAGEIGQTRLTVSTATLVSIDLTPATPSISKGLTQVFTATGHYSDSTSQDLSGVATWTSSSAGVATTAGATASAVGIGDTTITASYGGKSGQATLTVGPAALVSIDVAPPTPSLAKGLAQVFTATGHYSDATTQDLTALASWTSSATDVATMAGATATGVGVGTTPITASYGGSSGQATLTVTAATLVSIAVDPGMALVPQGLTTNLVATGTYTDGSTADLTAAATWTSDDETTATVSAGLVTAVRQGAAIVRAERDGRSGQAVVSVGAPALQSIALAPTSLSLARGVSDRLVATGHYTSGPDEDLTVLALWSSDDLSVATVDATGLVTATGAGNATVSASFGGQVGTATVAVTAPLLLSIDLAPAAPSIAKGLTQAFTATGHYSDATTQDLTGVATWSSSATGVATLAGATATGVGVGTTTISASQGAKSGSTTLTVGPAALVSIDVAPASPSVAKGLTQAFGATGHYTDATTQDLTGVATWTSSATGVATMAGETATGVGVGTTTITASHGGKSGQATLTVGAATLVAIDVAPASLSLAKGLAHTYTATAHWSDATSTDATATATWTTDDASVATALGNVVTAVQVGSTGVHAIAQGITGSASLTVTSAVVGAVTLSPANTTLAAGTTTQYTATAVYSDGSKTDVTAAAVWASTPETVATVSTTGRAQGIAAGSAVVSAVYSGISAQTSLTVTNAVLAAISVSPSTSTVPVGVSQAFTATGIFSDGTREDLTTQVTWSSSITGVASISNAAGTQGIATGVSSSGQGITVTIQATHLFGVTGTASLTVTNVTLQSITVDPPSASIAAGTGTAFTATALYSDLSTGDVTEFATWVSSTTTVATVSNDPGTRGVATGVGAGTTTVTASFGGQTDGATLTVTAAYLVGITVTPPTPTIPVGAGQQLTATGTFSDGSTQDVTSSVGWTSSDTAIADVSNAQGQEGLVTAITAGTVTVTATSAGVSASTLVTISTASLVSIDVTPATTTLPQGYSRQYAATAHYSDTTTRDVTTLVTWTSSNTTVATISNATGSQGLASGVAASATAVAIRATLSSVTGTASLTVTSASLSSIAVTPSPFSVAVRNTFQLRATGTFSDGLTLDITRQCNWSTLKRAIATVSRTGLLQGVGVGSTTIKARKGNTSGTAAANVTAN